MSSEIDPMIQKLVDHAIHHAAIARNGESNRATVNSIARALTARLRTPGTVEISREAAMHIGHFMRDASHFEVEFDQWVLVEIDAELAKEDPA